MAPVTDTLGSDEMDLDSSDKRSTSHVGYGTVSHVEKISIENSGNKFGRLKNRKWTLVSFKVGNSAWVI